MFDKDLDFKHILLNLEALKLEYNRVLMSFSYFNKKELIKWQKEVKNKIYSLNVVEWRKDKIWLYLNGDIDILTVKYLLNDHK